MLVRAFPLAVLLLAPVLVASPAARADFLTCHLPHPSVGYVCVIGNTRSEGEGNCEASPTYYDGTRSLTLVVGSGASHVTYVTLWGGCYHDQGAPSSGVQVIVSNRFVNTGVGWGGREGGFCETRVGSQGFGCPLGRPPSIEPPGLPLLP